MKNRKREICTSGSVRDEDGQPPHLLGRRKFLQLAAGAAALPAMPRMASAQAYPARPVTIVVPFAAGGGTDVSARIVGEYMARTLGQQFILRMWLEPVVRPAHSAQCARDLTATPS